MDKKKPTIAELEAILDGGPCKIMTNPDGSLTTKPCDEKDSQIKELVDAVVVLGEQARRGEKCMCGQILATLQVNYGKNGRNAEGICSEDDNVFQALIKVLTWYDKRCKATNKGENK